jgi:hypothetical protein
MNQAATEQISHTSGIYNTQGPTRNSALYGDETETVVALSKEVPQMPPPPLAQLPLSHGYFTGPAGSGSATLQPHIFTLPSVIPGSNEWMSRSAFAPVPRPNSRSVSYSTSTSQTS